jgi:adenylylsulfate kinase-like enzyme
MTARRERKTGADALKHVYWIGGTTCAGKTTISKRIAEEFGFVRYDCDARVGDHQAKATKGECPTLYSIRTGGGSA